jgi:hypothetical protein
MTNKLDQNSTDYVVAAAKAALGMVPFAGSLLAELAGSVIPKQRIDRLAGFAAALESKVGELHRDAVRAKLTDANFTDLLEETARHAARAVTEERREYLASLFAAGISEERVSFVESKHLLRILGELNDIEIVWLRYHLYPLLNEDTKFRSKHAHILEPVATTLNSDQEEIDKEALQNNYLEHLVSIGLLRRPLYIDSKTHGPVVHQATKNWRTQRAEVTPLGRLLLRHIGLDLDSERDEDADSEA